jgi:hypothetical protein
MKQCVSQCNVLFLQAGGPSPMQANQSPILPDSSSVLHCTMGSESPEQKISLNSHLHLSQLQHRRIW